MTFVNLVNEPAVHVRVQSGWALGRSADGASFTARNANGAPLPIGHYAPDFEAASPGLAAGAPLADLRNAVIEAGGAYRASAYLLWLQRLNGWWLLEFPLVDEAGERAVVLPQWTSFVPVLAPDLPPAEAGLDRFACLRRDGGAWLVESPLAGARLRLPDLAALDAPLVRRALHAAGLLETERPETDPRREALAQWEFHDLLFHAHSRGGWHRDPLGAMFPFIGEIDPLPATRPAWPGERIELPRAPNDPGREPFSEVLERRRSERFYDETRPISRRDLGALLDRAARIRSSERVPVGNFMGRSGTFEITRRPYPNGGASYELEIYPVVDRCDGLDSGLYHYDPAAHELVRIAGRTPEVKRVFAEARVATAYQARPQIVLAISARFARVTWKYKSMAYATILRNTGALYQTLYLAATELGLAPCGIGSGDSALFARITGLDPVVEGTVGEFILGGRPRGDTGSELDLAKLRAGNLTLGVPPFGDPPPGS